MPRKIDRAFVSLGSCYATSRCLRDLVKKNDVRFDVSSCPSLTENQSGRLNNNPRAQPKGEFDAVVHDVQYASVAVSKRR